LKGKLFLFLKGFFMGSADVIPGVSGGTIALVTGIYERLLEGIRSVDLKLPLYLIRGEGEKAAASLREIDLFFFLPLSAGIISALLLGARLVTYFLDRFPAFTYAFFCGLIFASAYLVYGRSRENSPAFFLALSIGLIGATLFVGLETLAMNHGALVLFASGAVAVCAMILPGISGAFILLLLGQYRFILEAVQNPLHKLPSLSLFVVGAAVGLPLFAHLLGRLLDRHKNPTLGFLTGLMLGALRRPVEEILSSVTAGGKSWGLGSPALSTALLFLSALGGVAIVVLFGSKTEVKGDEAEASPEKG